MQENQNNSIADTGIANSGIAKPPHPSVERVVVVFNDDYQVAAFIELEAGDIAINSHDDAMAPRIREALAFLRERKPQLTGGQPNPETGQMEIVSMPVSADEPEYLDALVAELQAKDFFCSAAPRALEEILLLLSNPKISAEHREEVLGDVLHMPVEQINEFIESIRALEASKNGAI